MVPIAASRTCRLLANTVGPTDDPTTSPNIVPRGRSEEAATLGGLVLSFEPELEVLSRARSESTRHSFVADDKKFTQECSD